MIHRSTYPNPSPHTQTQTINKATHTQTQTINRATHTQTIKPVGANNGHHTNHPSYRLETHAADLKSRPLIKKIITGANPFKKNHHLYKHQQQFFDQNPNTNTSWIPFFLAEREKKHKHKKLKYIDQNPPSILLWFWFWFDLRDQRIFVLRFCKQNLNPKTLENLNLKREW